MKRLHPPSAQEEPLCHGIVRNMDGEAEVWTAHRTVDARIVVRVEVAERDLWHLSLAAGGRPERIQARVRDASGLCDATFTFFDDETLIWRRGGGSASEALALPSGYGLMWPPIAGRGWLLAGLGAKGDGPARIVKLVTCSAREGAVKAELGRVAVEADGSTWRLVWPDGEVDSAEIAADGRVLTWLNGARRAEEMAAAAGDDAPVSAAADDGDG